jgi:predicted HAD superfamily Cof-like phosphohydrolase
MNKQLKLLEEFNTSFNIEFNDSPSLISSQDYLLRHMLMQEENDEYLEAAKAGDLVEVADALGDQLYILCGTILKHGLQHKIVEVFEEIHRSNMSKLGDDSKPLINGLNVFDTEQPIGKILKSKNYFKPDLKKFL